MRDPLRLNWKWLGLSAWVGLLILLFYGSALQLPFLADDYFQFPFVDRHNMIEIWQTAGGLYYFRPLAFAVWKLMDGLFGAHNPAPQHVLNLLLHGCNAVGTAWLAGVLWANDGKVAWRQWLSATLFVVFPFSYEAVPWVGAMMHPLVTLLILLSASAYVKMRQTGSRGWAMLSLLFAFFSPFAHENGILIVPLLGAIELTWPAPWSTLWRRLQRIAVWLMPIGIWYVVWRTVPAAQGGAGAGINRLAEIWRNFVYATQGSAYPVTWLGGWLHDDLGVNAPQAALGLSVLGGGIAAFIQWRTKASRRGWLPWLWIAIAIAPALLFLEFAYFSAAPRTLMLASVGSAWLWTDVFVRLASWGRVGTWRRTASTALAMSLVIGLLVQNGLLIRSQMKLYDMAGAVVRQIVAATVSANRQGQAAAFINLPVWIASPRLNYALGQEGIVFGPAPDQLDTMVSVHTGQPAQMQGLRFEAIRDVAPYFVGLLRFPGEWRGLAQTSSQVFVTRYLTDTIVVQPAGALHLPQTDEPVLAHFEQTVSLLSATTQRTPVGVQVNLIWRLDQALPPDVTAFVHVLDANGQLSAQADGDPLANTYPFTQWPPGSIVRDVRTIEVVDPASVRVGLYNRASGERLTALTAEDQALPDNAVPITLQEQLP